MEEALDAERTSARVAVDEALKIQDLSNRGSSWRKNMKGKLEEETKNSNKGLAKLERKLFE